MADLLAVANISKSFPGVRALHEVGFSIGEGECVALIGENGAGKSTLMKILAGVQPPDSGEIRLNEKEIEIRSVEEGLEHGIALIHQELNLATNLSVGANIFLGREPRKLGMIDEKEIADRSTEFLERVGLDVRPDTLVGELTIGKQQLVEIAKALSTNAKILIMDEPTSSLSQGETEKLFEVAKDLKKNGVSIIYISHRLGEVIELADRVVVLRDGENAGELAREEITHDAMVSLMVGRELSQFYSHDAGEPGDVVLSVSGVRTPAHPSHEVSFDLRAGEIVGMAGLVGAGRTELLETLFGVTPALSGTMEVEGKEIPIQSPREAIAAGLALVPEDRKQQGLVIEMAVADNVSLASLERDQKAGFLNFDAESKLTAEMTEKMRIKTPSSRQVVRFLSGGNQQKVVIGKWLAMKPKILLLDEPTRGIDIGAKQEIYALMEELADQGVAILFVSSEMEEILGMSDRALVMHEGKFTGELKRDELTEEAVMQLATGRIGAAA
ncbi:MAG: D-xylose ABC transporter ATP-binding protein [Verrucomicrobiales bacterium]|nr:D-xylose ABC transporter ATP-binding protein [Verrucomicrobiales bacterium]